MLTPVRVAVILLITAGSNAQLADGQERLFTGQTVRLTLRGDTARVTGVLSSLTPTAWSVTSGRGQVTRVLPADIAGAELLVSRRNTVRGVLIGGGVGLLGGLLMVAMADDNCDQDSTGLCDAFVDAGFKTPVLILTPVAGAALGALVGTLISSSRWVPAIGPSDLGGALSLRWSTHRRRW